MNKILKFFRELEYERAAQNKSKEQFFINYLKRYLVSSDEPKIAIEFCNTIVNEDRLKRKVLTQLKEKTFIESAFTYEAPRNSPSVSISETLKENEKQNQIADYESQ